MKEIGLIEHLTPRVIASRIDRMHFEYGVRSTTQLVAFLITNNLLVDRNVEKAPINDKKAQERTLYSEHARRLLALEDLRKNINKLLNTYKDNL